MDSLIVAKVTIDKPTDWGHGQSVSQSDRGIGTFWSNAATIGHRVEQKRWVRVFFFVCKEGSQQNVVDIMSSIVTKYQQQQQQQRESCFVELRSINQESLCSLVKRSQAFIKNCCPVIVTDHVVVVCRLSSTCPASIVIEWDDRGYSYHSTRSFL